MANTKGEALDYKKLAEAIVYAQQEAEFLRQKEQEKLARKRQQQWLNVLGQKTYTKENRITRICIKWLCYLLMELLFFQRFTLSQIEFGRSQYGYCLVPLYALCLLGLLSTVTAFIAMALALVTLFVR